MKFFKGNQIVIYIIALMLITAGYLNYTNKEDSVETSSETKNETNIETKNETNNIKDKAKVGDIGDATLVNSNDVVTDNKTQVNNEIKTNTVQTNTTTNNNNDYFVSSKLEREKMYSQTVEIYEKILNSGNSLETQKQIATEEIKKINEIKNSIMICENLIKTKGFENSIIFVNGDSINVIIGTKTLEKEEVSQIQNIILREMNSKSENIHIATK